MSRLLISSSLRCMCVCVPACKCLCVRECVGSAQKHSVSERKRRSERVYAAPKSVHVKQIISYYTPTPVEIHFFQLKNDGQSLPRMLHNDKSLRYPPLVKVNYPLCVNPCKCYIFSFDISTFSFFYSHQHDFVYESETVVKLVFFLTEMSQISWCPRGLLSRIAWCPLGLLS